MLASRVELSAASTESAAPSAAVVIAKEGASVCGAFLGLVTEDKSASKARALLFKIAKR